MDVQAGRGELGPSGVDDIGADRAVDVPVRGRQDIVWVWVAVLGEPRKRQREAGVPDPARFLVDEASGGAGAEQGGLLGSAEKPVAGAQPQGHRGLDATTGNVGDRLQREPGHGEIGVDARPSIPGHSLHVEVDLRRPQP
jgi:hypothetical protein